MAHSLSAIKRQRQSIRRRERNRAGRSAARTAVRRARELIAAGDTEQAQDAARAASAILDRQAGKRVLHPNNAARRKSRMMRALHAGAGEQTAPRKRATSKKTSKKS